MDGFKDILNSLQSISLKEMDGVSLLDRVDTKFILNFDQLGTLLNSLKAYYSVLSIEGKRFANYETIYYDYEDLRLYKDHHNGKKNRYKIRRRSYTDSALSFLEIKFKTNKGKTLKSRIDTPIKDSFNSYEQLFIKDNSPLDFDSLTYFLTNNFKRITLVSKKNIERVTIDFDISFSKKGKEKTLTNLVVVEIKTQKGDKSSDALKFMRSNKISEASFSKYCTGITLLYKGIKYNNFKSRLITLNKLHEHERVLWRSPI